VHIPSQAVSETMTMMHIPQNTASLAEANAGFRMGSIAFSLQAVTASGVFLSDAMLAQPMTLTVRYTAGDLKAAGGEPARLALMTYRAEAGQWLALETAADAQAGVVAARTRRAGLFALMAQAAPENAVAAEGVLSATTLLQSVAVVGGLGVLGLWLRVRRRALRAAAARPAIPAGPDDPG